MTSEPENTHLSSPVSWTDMVMVPVKLTQAMREAATEVRVDDGRSGFTALNWEEADAVYAAMLSASPTPPIPMIAEAGERGLRAALVEARAYVERKSLDAFDDREDTLLKRIDAALSTPATLDNTAVRVTGGWTPRVGEEVRTTDAVHEKYGEWRDAQLWVAEVRAERNRGDRLNITVTDQWPMGKQADLTDGFYVGGDALDDLCPIATLTAKTEKAE